VSRDQLGRLAEEQAALRRVATLVAGGAPPAEVFATVVEEVGRLLGTDLAHMVRFEPDETVTTVAGWSREGDHQPVGWRSPIKATDLSRVVVRTGRPARIDRYAEVPPPQARSGIPGSPHRPDVVEAGSGHCASGSGQRFDQGGDHAQPVAALLLTFGGVGQPLLVNPEDRSPRTRGPDGQLQRRVVGPAWRLPGEPDAVQFAEAAGLPVHAGRVVS
jgi:hypothetical protein